MRQGTAVRLSLRDLLLAGLCVAALALVAAAPASASRVLLSEHALDAAEVPPSGDFEGACGIAFIGTTTYVSDYYHHAIDVFEPGNPLKQLETDPLDGACQLATGPGGALYANNWHEGVERLLPSVAQFDSAESTGVAVDSSTGKVYVDDRTYVAVYQPSGAFIEQIGLGSLEDAYGLAVFGGKVYVADAGSDTVKFYEPSVDPNTATTIDGAATPQNGFNSLVDAALAVDPTNGHLLVLDNLQPSFEHPQAAIDEFDATGGFLSQLSRTVVDGEPSGLVVDESSGNLYATNGNDEGSSVYEFGPYTVAPAIVSTPAPGDTDAAAAGSAAASAPAATGQDSASGQAELRLTRVSPSSDEGATAALRVEVGSPGVLAVSGSGLRSIGPHRVSAGSTLLRVHLDRRGRRALTAAKLHRLRTRAIVTFTADAGSTARRGQVVNFRQQKRGER